MNAKTLIDIARLSLGYPSIKHIRGAGSDITGFDCSGFINFLLKQANYPDEIPRYTSQLFDNFGILIHKKFVKAGDLVFFSEDGTRPTHVGLMISEDRYIHAPGKDDSKIIISLLKERLIKDEAKSSQIYAINPIGFKRITINGSRYQKLFLEY
jgi:cell wall-associated NlpC family hydrolase